MTFFKHIFFLPQPVTFLCSIGISAQSHQVVFLLFDGHLTAIFDATKLPQFLVLIIHRNIYIFYACIYMFYVQLLVRRRIIHQVTVRQL